MKFRIVLAQLLVLGLFACSSDPTTSGGHDAGVPDDGSMGAMDSGGGSNDSGIGADSSASKPATPQLLGVAKLSGGLHVTWKLNDTGLTGTELWRKKDTGSYAKLTGLPGTATSYHDASASTGGANYCYQVMTLKGSEMSDMSNEVCGTP